MSQLTKNAIIDATFRLAEKKPLQKITVHDIVNACGITRNTFYYYFHDIFDVFDCVLAEKVSAVGDYSDDHFDEAVFDLFEFCSHHKRVLQNLYRSLGYDRLSHHLRRPAEEFLRRVAEKQLGKEKIPELDLRIITTFYTEAALGILSRWAEGPDPTPEEETRDTLDRIRVIFKGNLALTLENSLKNSRRD